MTVDLSRNLQILCARVKSVSALCRELAINRQQFARYLTGESRPSPYNLGKISDYFGLPVNVLELPHDAFMRREDFDGPSAAGPGTLSSKILDGPSESIGKLKRHAGFYSVYMQSPTDPARLLRSLVQLYMRGDRMMSRWEESFKRAEDGSTQSSRYEGVVRLLNGYLFIVDVETTVGDTILETILQVPYRRRSDFLTGLTMGMTTGRRRMPFVSVAVFKYLGKKIDSASKRGHYGFVDVTSKNVEPTVRNVFSNQGVAHFYPKAFEQL